MNAVNNPADHDGQAEDFSIFNLESLAVAEKLEFFPVEEESRYQKRKRVNRDAVIADNARRSLRKRSRPSPGYTANDNANRKNRADNTPNERQQAFRENHPDYVLDHNASRYQAHGEKRRKAYKPFAGVDGEGATRNRHGQVTHQYVLLRAGDHVLSDPVGLIWHRILDWICHLPKDHTYVSFYFDYDVTMILRQCKLSQWKRLVKSENHTALIGDDNRGWWLVKYLPRSHFQVTPMKRDPSKRDGKGFAKDSSRGDTILISDTCKFFQAAFMKVLKDWNVCNAEIFNNIARGKENRGIVEFLDLEEIADVTEYNRLECVYLAKIMELLREAADSSDIYPAQWEGPGWIAASILRSNGIPKRKEWEARLEQELGATTAKRIHDIGSASFYGGWFESSLFGPVPGNSIGPVRKAHSEWCMWNPSQVVTETDLKAAYPYAITKLPCLRHSTFEQRMPKAGEYALQFAEVTYSGYADNHGTIRQPDGKLDDEFPWFMGLPHRDKTGRICHPLETTGWYWNFELDQARHQNIRILESWVWVNDRCDCRPWEFVWELFNLRLELEHTQANTGQPIKLGLNSLFGKLVQRVGNQTFTIRIAGSFITAFTRTTMMRTIHEQSCEKGLQCGSNVVMVATDAIFWIGDPGFGDPHCERLGEWKKIAYPDGLFIVQGGIYWPLGGTAKFKTRGVPVNVIRAHEKEFEDAFKRMIVNMNPADGVVTLTHKFTADGNRERMQRFIGLREAVHRNLMRVGYFEPYERKIGFNWYSKRAVHHVMATGNRNPERPLWTVPRAVENPESVPYHVILENVSPEGYIPWEINDQVHIDNMLDDTPEWETRFISPTKENIMKTEADDYDE